MRSSSRMLGSDAILRALEHEGVDVAFGIPGGAILPTYDAIARGTTVRHVLARHEQGAGHMAEGYARASGKVGVAIATSGPGATNLVTAIADAWMDSTPVVFVTGQVRSNLIGTDAFQEVDITGITMPIVKHSWLVQDIEELPSVMKAAFHVARTGRQGPVLVDVAKDVQEAEIDFAYPDDVDLPGWKPPRKVHPRQVRAAAEAILRAERPVVYAGGGVLNAEASEELRTLVDVGRLPAVVTLMGKGGLPDSHPLNYGAPGMHGSKYANWALNKADLVIAVGSRFDDRVTGKVSAFAPGAKVIHFDIDAAEVGKIRHAEIPVVGPLKLGLAELVAELQALAPDGPPDRTPWLRQVEEWRERFPFRYAKGDGPLKPQTAIEALRDAAAGLDHDVVWTTGVGQHQMWAMQYLVCDTPRSFITSGGLGTMGYGVPAAIGAKAARPDATVVCIDGDGCFQMTCQELATAALEGLPIVTVVINNGWLGMVRQWQEMFYAERFAQTHLTHAVPDYAQLAEAFGCAGFTVETEGDLEDAIASAFSAGRSAVIDVRCDPEEKCFPMVPAGAAAVDVIEAPEAEAVGA
ncbi:MAG TPA: biosynthetic-type acetolactate synthase large subunit [Gaiellaceae bacterium]